MPLYSSHETTIFPPLTSLVVIPMCLTILCLFFLLNSFSTYYFIWSVILHTLICCILTVNFYIHLGMTILFCILLVLLIIPLFLAYLIFVSSCPLEPSFVIMFEVLSEAYVLLQIIYILFSHFLGDIICLQWHLYTH